MTLWTPPSHIVSGVASSDQFNAETVDNLLYLKEGLDSIGEETQLVTQAFGGVIAVTKAPGESFTVGLLPVAFTIPFDGYVLSWGTLVFKQTDPGYLRAEVSPDGGGMTMVGDSVPWEAETAFHGIHGHIAFNFLTVVTAGDWEPTIAALNHSDSSVNMYLNQVSGTHLLTTDYAGFVP